MHMTLIFPLSQASFRPCLTTPLAARSPFANLRLGKHLARGISPVWSSAMLDTLAKFSGYQRQLAGIFVRHPCTPVSNEFELTKLIRH